MVVNSIIRRSMGTFKTKGGGGGGGGCDGQYLRVWDVGELLFSLMVVRLLKSRSNPSPTLKNHY